MITCPDISCQGHSKVTDTRFSDRLQTLRRRRECLTCGKRWSTVEILAETYEKLSAVKTTIEKLLTQAKSCPL